MKRLITVLAAAALLAGCFVTETGNPPARPVVDDVLLEGKPNFGTTLDLYSVVGNAGAVEPPEGVVHLINLDDPELLAATVSVEEDGSFPQVDQVVPRGEEARMWVEGPDGSRSLPVDLIPGSVGLNRAAAVATASRPIGD